MKYEGHIKDIFRRVLIDQNHGLPLQEWNCPLKSPLKSKSIIKYNDNEFH